MIRRLLGWLSSETGGEAARPVSGSGQRVLLVDDDAHLRQLLKIELEDRGYAVEEASNGAEALERLETFTPRVIVLDANMPVLDGFATLAKLRGRRSTRDIPVVMLTTRSHQGDVVAGYRRGAQAYLTKPFMPEEVIENVKRLMQNRL